VVQTEFAEDCADDVAPLAVVVNVALVAGLGTLVWSSANARGASS
jgi:hypothetical protein